MELGELLANTLAQPPAPWPRRWHCRHAMEALGAAGVFARAQEGLAQAVAAWEQAGACGSPLVALALASHGAKVLPLLARHGDPLLQEAFVTPALKGELVATLWLDPCALRPNTPAGLALRPVLEKGEAAWLAHGELTGVLNADQSHAVLCLGQTPGKQTPSLLLLPTDLPGVATHAPAAPPTPAGVSLCSVTVEGAVLPAHLLVGAPAQGLALLGQANPWWEAGEAWQVGAAAALLGEWAARRPRPGQRWAELNTRRQQASLLFQHAVGQPQLTPQAAVAWAQSRLAAQILLHDTLRACRRTARFGRARRWPVLRRTRADLALGLAPQPPWLWWEQVQAANTASVIL